MNLDSQWKAIILWWIGLYNC